MLGYDDIMVDLETMDNKPTSAITAIGAVLFNTEGGFELGPTFYQKVDLQSSIDAGLTVSGSTINWWLTQNEEARLEMAKQGIPLNQALEDFSGMFDGGERLWGNGSSFDNAILTHAYAKVGLPLPWKFWNDRCYRTIKNDYPQVPFVREGTHHNALADAVSQAKHLIEIYKEIANAKIQQTEVSLSS